MTLEEAIELANQGNLEVMTTLASYYYDHNEYNEAKAWYCRAAEGGLVQAFIPAALLTSMLSRATRKVSGGDAIRDQDVNDLTQAVPDEFHSEEGFFFGLLHVLYGVIQIIAVLPVFADQIERRHPVVSAAFRIPCIKSFVLAVVFHNFAEDVVYQSDNAVHNAC